MRFGLIGCGWAGQMRADAIAAVPGLRLSAASDVEEARGRALAQGRGAAFERDWRALIQREDVEAVIVSTPPPLHAEMCLAAFEQGKHVLCEKPLARNPEEARPILDAAARAGRLLATGFNLRFFPPIAKAREIFDSGQIGELDHIRSYAGHPGGKEFGKAWVHDPAVMGGGAMVDNGIHLLDLTCHFLGGVAEVKGYATGHVWQFPGCEDNGFALLRNAQGKVATVHASWSEWAGYQFRIEVYGTRGCVKASYPPMFVQMVQSDPASGRSRRTRFLFPKLQILERLRSYRWAMLRSFAAEMEAFARQARGEKTRIAAGIEGLWSLEAAHGVYRSSADGGAVRLGS